MVAAQPRSTPSAAHRRCCSVPSTASAFAIAGPSAQKKPTPGLAQNSISATAHVSGAGAGTPPISSAMPSRHHCASRTARTVSAISSDTEMLWVAGSNTGGLRSAATNDAATGPSASRATSPSIVRAVSVSRSP